MKNNRLSVLIFLVLLISCSAQLVEGSLDSAYQKYVSAYRNYQNAISARLSKAEIESAASDFKNARVAYEALLNRDSSTDAAVDRGTVKDSGGNLQAETANTAGRSDADRSLASLTAALPDELESLVTTLKQTSSKAEAAKIITALEKYLESDSRSIHKPYLQYEMASAFDRLGIDAKKAENLFAEVSKNTGNKLVAAWGGVALKYLKARQYKAQWSQVMAGKFAEMTSAFNSYQNSSWLAFPVKAVRGTVYLAKSVSYINTQNKHEDFLLAFESAQAPFVANVESVFAQYQATRSEAEDIARIRLIYNNYQAWYARWKVMGEARQTLDIQYFIIDNDAFGLGLLGMCLKKAQEGVKIRLMVDARGSSKLSLKVMAKGYLEELAKLPNVSVKVYNPFQSSLIGAITDFRRIVSSNHDKILIVDGRYAIIGGRNIADEYLVDAVDNAKAWRDTDVLIDSEKVASQLQAAFEEEFNILKAFEVGRSLVGMTKYRTLQMEIGYAAMDAALNLRGPISATSRFSTQAAILKQLNEQLSGYKNMTGFADFELADKSHQCPVHILDSNSISGPRNDITENIVKYIDGSRREIIIQNPYVVLTPRAEAALKRAARRRVPILVHTNSPQTSDSFPTEAMLYRDWKSILRDMPTMRIFARVNEGQLHGKNFVFDRKIGVVGTYNFDFLSEKVNSEVVAAVKSPEFATELRNEVVYDMRKSVEYHLATADRAEFGPGNVENPQKMWLIKLLSKMGWLKPLF
ncbi:MAG TPA: phospholipase D-like domain-containing protein [Candidatus Rifleibacterium sp.]|nr:phospholipase D-like domain-containing protein [Candidatus Rifleibacterium sp.]